MNLDDLGTVGVNAMLGEVALQVIVLGVDESSMQKDQHHEEAESVGKGQELHPPTDLRTGGKSDVTTHPSFHLVMYPCKYVLMKRAGRRKNYIPNLLFS